MRSFQTVVVRIGLVSLGKAVEEREADAVAAPSVVVDAAAAEVGVKEPPNCLHKIVTTEHVLYDLKHFETSNN